LNRSEIQFLKSSQLTKKDIIFLSVV